MTVPTHSHPNLNKLVAVAVILSGAAAVYSIYCNYHQLKIHKLTYSKMVNGTDKPKV